MDLKIKEALAFFILIIVISIAAGGDYYAQMHEGKCAVTYPQQKKKNNKGNPGNPSLTKVILPSGSDSSARKVVSYNW